MAKKTATFEDHMSTQRERFEALIKPNQRSKFLDAHNRVTETYVESHIRGMWEGFQLGEASGMERAAAECERLSTAIDDDLAQFIRTIDGNNAMGAGALAEQIANWYAAYGREHAQQESTND